MKWRCDTCRFWVSPTNQRVASDRIRSERGDCRVYPPNIAVMKDFVTNAWPMTKSDDWCGSWEPEDGA